MWLICAEEGFNLCRDVWFSIVIMVIAVHCVSYVLSSKLFRPGLAMYSFTLSFRLKVFPLLLISTCIQDLFMSFLSLVTAAQLYKVLVR